MSRRTPLMLACLGASSALAVALVGPASADGGGRSRVEMQDDCDPVTFNQALGPGACVGDGETTFDQLVQELVTTHTADEWRMHPKKIKVRRGHPLTITNEGGEFHTFTEVADFGPGCVQAVNDLVGLSGPPAADCGAAFADPQTALPAGGTGMIDTHGMSMGTHKFECMIHPWMTATVRVRN